MTQNTRDAIDYAHAKRFARKKHKDSRIAATNKYLYYSMEIAHEQNTFERRIYGMTIRQIFHRSFNEQRKPF